MQWNWALQGFDVGAARSVREAVVDILSRRTDANADALAAAAVVAGELIANAFRYGTGERIDVTLTCTSERPLLAVTNEGAPFDMDAMLPPTDQEHGRGIYLITELASAPTVSAAEGRCTVSVEFPLAVVAQPEGADDPAVAPEIAPNFEIALGLEGAGPATAPNGA